MSDNNEQYDYIPKDRQDSVSSLALRLMKANEDIINDAIIAGKPDVDIVMAIGISFCDTTISVLDAIYENNSKRGAEGELLKKHIMKISDSIIEATTKSFDHYKSVLGKREGE